MRRSLIWIAALAFAIGCLLPACSQQPPPAQSGGTAGTMTEPAVSPAFPITITDRLGRKVTIEHLPQRIVSLAPSNTEILFALGLDDRIAGVTDYCDYPEKAKLKPRVAGYMTPDIEKIVSIAPDLVLAESIHEKTVLPALEKVGMPVIVLSAHTVDDIIGNISLVGSVTGSSAAALQLTRQLSGRIKTITAKTDLLPPGKRPRVMYVIWYDPIWTMGGKSYIDDLISKAGGANIFSTDFENSRIVSPESIVSKNPQVLIITGMAASADAIASNLRQQDWTQTTDAIKNNRVYKLSDANLIDRPGPRIVDGLEEVTGLLGTLK
ncbi:MAG: cobalamin-binding protein [Chloroflexi bacterium]|nr:cobalamin-binding protein [Chloroflexota bacterium]